MRSQARVKEAHNTAGCHDERFDLSGEREWPQGDGKADQNQPPGSRRAGTGGITRSYRNPAAYVSEKIRSAPTNHKTPVAESRTLTDEPTYWKGTSNRTTGPCPTIRGRMLVRIVMVAAATPTTAGTGPLRLRARSTAATIIVC
jgi:hypothetical protein